ncbi:MAG: hypothetical protein SWY16_16565 [Cyanobacteriota bacterium]|nr:hypothetical protein [Cyanobacteriota bacterium]
MSHEVSIREQTIGNDLKAEAQAELERAKAELFAQRLRKLAWIIHEPVTKGRSPSL